MLKMRDIMNKKVKKHSRCNWVIFFEKDYYIGNNCFNYFSFM